MAETKTHTLADFASGADEHVKRLRESGEAEALTVNGESVVIVQDVAAYERILERIEALETVGAVKESMAAYERGEGLSLGEGMASLRNKHAVQLSYYRS